jgi:hypothetical protein
MYRPVFVVLMCGAGAAAMKPAASLAFAGAQIPQLKNAGHAATSRRTCATQPLAMSEEQSNGWMSNAKKSMATSFFAASLALSGFSGVVNTAPVNAEMMPEAKLVQAPEFFSGNFLIAEDGAGSAIKVTPYHF